MATLTMGVAEVRIAPTLTLTHLGAGRRQGRFRLTQGAAFAVARGARRGPQTLTLALTLTLTLTLILTLTLFPTPNPSPAWPSP